MAAPLILLTGATGFIGFRTLVLLLEAGYRVRAAVRTRAGFDRISALQPVSPHAARLDCFVVADMAVPGAYDEAVKGVKYIIHSASPTSRKTMLGPHDAVFIDPAVKGTVGMLESASRAPGVQRVVITGSPTCMTSVKTAFEGKTVTEQSEILTPPHPYDDDLIAYTASKVHALRAARSFMLEKEPSFDAIHVMPTLVLGRDDTVTKARNLFSGTNAVLMCPLLGYGIKFPLLGTSVHVDDVAKIHVAALDPKIEGNQDFIAAAPPMGTVDWAKVLEIIKRRYPREYRQGLLGAAPLSMSVPGKVDGSKAQRVLGITYKTLEEQVVSVVDQFLELSGRR